MEGCREGAQVDGASHCVACAPPHRGDEIHTQSCALAVPALCYIIITIAAQGQGRRSSDTHTGLYPICTHTHIYVYVWTMYTQEHTCILHLACTKTQAHIDRVNGLVVVWVQSPGDPLRRWGNSVAGAGRRSREVRVQDPSPPRKDLELQFRRQQEHRAQQLHREHQQRLNRLQKWWVCQRITGRATHKCIMCVHTQQQQQGRENSCKSINNKNHKEFQCFLDVCRSCCHVDLHRSVSVSDQSL